MVPALKKSKVAKPVFLQFGHTDRNKKGSPEKLPFYRLCTKLFAHKLHRCRACYPFIW